MQFGPLLSPGKYTLSSPSKCKWDDAGSPEGHQRWAYKMILVQLRGAGERGRTIRTFDTRIRLDRLVKAGYVASQATGLDLVHYRITKHGESALSDASRLI